MTKEVEMRKVEWLAIVLAVVLLFATACDGESIYTGSSQAPFENSALEPTIETAQNINSYQMVWIPRTGEKYHSYAGCCGMVNPSEVTITHAKNMGYTACSNCW